MKTYSIALIPGDGIGPAVTEAAWQVVEAVARGADFTVQGTRLPWSCDLYLETGAMMPADRPHMLRRKLSDMEAIEKPAQVGHLVGGSDFSILAKAGIGKI